MHRMIVKFSYENLLFEYNSKYIPTKIPEKFRGCELVEPNNYSIGPLFVFQIVEKFFTGQTGHSFCFPTIYYGFLETEKFLIIVDAINSSPARIAFIEEAYRSNPKNPKLSVLFSKLIRPDIRKPVQRELPYITRIISA